MKTTQILWVVIAVVLAGCSRSAGADDGAEAELVERASCLTEQVETYQEAADGIETSLRGDVPALIEATRDLVSETAKGPAGFDQDFAEIANERFTSNADRLFAAGQRFFDLKEEADGLRCD